MTAVSDASPRARTRALSTDRRLLIAVVVLCVLGIGDAGYLTYVHYAGLKVLCLSSGGCETVQASRWAKLDGIPVSVLGLIGYIGILGSLAIRSELGRAAGFAIALIGFGFSMYLTYRELFTIKAICQWCVGSAVLMTAVGRDHRRALPARRRPRSVSIVALLVFAHLGHWYVQLAFAAPALVIIGYLLRDSVRRRLRERRGGTDPAPGKRR